MKTRTEEENDDNLFDFELENQIFELENQNMTLPAIERLFKHKELFRNFNNL
jgi:hypothetical protein